MAAECGTITVQEPFSSNQVNTTSCFTQQATIAPGENVNVGTQVSNNNDVAAQVTVELFVDGSSVASNTQTVAGNNQAGFTFDFSSSSPGNFDLSTEVTSASRA